MIAITRNFYGAWLPECAWLGVCRYIYRRLVLFIAEPVFALEKSTSEFIVKRFFTLGLLIVFPGLFACASVDSSDVRTSGVLPIIEVTANGDGKTLVYTSLRVGGPLSNTFLDLSEGDRLEVKSDDEQSVMTRNVSWTNVIHYTAELNGDDEDKSIEVAWLRADGDDAPSSALTLPAPFNITRPASGEWIVGSTDDLIIAWDNAGKNDQLTLSLSGPCIDGYSKVVDDTGIHTIPAGTLTYSGDEEADTTDCTTEVTLERKRFGEVDPAFAANGAASAYVRRKASIGYSP